jgi:hypothetical protein
MMLKPRPVNEGVDRAKDVVVNLSDRQRAYLRRWILRWVAENGELKVPTPHRGAGTGVSPPPLSFKEPLS